MGHDRIRTLQILRFVAAAMVVVRHAFGAAMDQSVLIGDSGVDIFFVLSGLVIATTGPLAPVRPTGIQFFWRRWRRVAPAFFLASAPYVVVAAATGHLNWPQTIATFLFWPAAGSRMVDPYLIVGWTLCFEMVFYTTVSFLLLGDRLRRNLAILAASAAVLFLAKTLSPWLGFRFLTDPVFVEFGVGVFLAMNLGRLRKAPAWLGMGLVVGSLVVFLGEAVALAARQQTYEGWTRVLMWGGPSAMMVAGLCVCDRFVRGRLAGALAWLGDASYSIYLTHQMFFWVVLLAIAPIVGVQSPVTALFNAIVGVAGGALCYVIVERPLLRDLKLTRQPHGASAPALRLTESSAGNGVST